MKRFIKIIICLALAISIPGQKAPAFTDKNSQTASTIIGLVAAGACLNS